MVCSNGSCEVAFSVNLSADSSFSVLTAAEAGVDWYASSFSPALYWNQVAGIWECDAGIPWACNSNIVWKSTSNMIYSCNISDHAIGTPPQNCGTNSYALDWPASGGMAPPGNGLQVDISNLLFVPAPINSGTPDSEGLLIIGTYTNGYLAYHSPVIGNASTETLLSSINNGQVGNINSLINDVYGNIFFATSETGLFAFNPFTLNNVFTTSDITLIPNTVDSSGSSGGLPGKILTGVEIAYYSVRTIATLAALGSEQAPANAVAYKPLTGLRSGLALGRVGGQESYQGQFLFTEAQLQGLGLVKGAIIKGLKFRSSEGITPDPKASISFRKFVIALSQGKSINKSNDLSLSFVKNIGKYRKIVKTGPLTLDKQSFPANKVYPGSTDQGQFAKPILFDRPYAYLGGSLLMDISHGGQRDMSPFQIDAIGTSNLQALYWPRVKGGKPQRIKVVPAVEFVYD